MQALGKHFREHGLYTFVRWNTFANIGMKSKRVNDPLAGARGTNSLLSLGSGYAIAL